MARKCDVCGKGMMRGKRVSHANNRSLRTWLPNLQHVRAIVDGKPQRLNVCTSCLKKGKVQKNIRGRNSARTTESTNA